jgi:hypothetical protein
VSRKDDLVQHVRESYALVREYEEILRLSGDPKELARARREMKERWDLLRGCLEELRRLGGELPPDAAEIAAGLPPGPGRREPAGGESEYPVHIERATGVASGDGAHVETYVAPPSPAEPRAEPVREPAPAGAVGGGDVYARYAAGLARLLAGLERGHPRYQEALVWQQRLEESIAQARLYGDTETRRAERAEVVGRLNGLALETVGVSFNELAEGTPRP